MLGNMRILVSVPSISFKNVEKNKLLLDNFYDQIKPFELKDNTLDVFSEELKNIKSKKLWGVNIPHFSLEEKGASGLAGPGKPNEELFYPIELKEKFKNICGQYDKWRPYPSKVASNYDVNMAKRFTGKRCRVFKKAVQECSWDVIFYVEHSPASLANASKEESLRLAETVFKETILAKRHWPSLPVVLFSPYGIGKEEGFLVTNHIDNTSINTWEGIRSFLNGSEL